MVQKNSKTTGKIPATFQRDLEKFTSQLLEGKEYLIISHHDADGITSCAIMVDFLRAQGKEVVYRCIKQLDSRIVQEIKTLDYETLVFTDMGSGQLSILEEYDIKDCFIVDHHEPEKKYERQINPHFYGFDGGRDISASGMAYLVARAGGWKHLPHLAIIGAIGDMQESDGRLHSLNRFIMEEAIAQGKLKVKNDLRIFGRQSRPLTQMLTYANEPIIPGLSGNQVECASFIEGLGIELQREDGSWKTYVDLTWEERKKLLSALYIHLLNYNTPEFIIQKLVGEVYTLVDEAKYSELRDGKEFATLLNACGRQEECMVGVKVCLGNRNEALSEARRLLERHRAQLRQGLEFLAQSEVQTLENLYYFDGSGRIKESIIGVIAGMAYGAQIIPPDKPVLAFAEDKDDPTLLKVSARANWELVNKGIHLGEAMREQSRKVGGEGGGHDIAAGARIPRVKRDEFLNGVNKQFARQLGLLSA